MVDFFLNGGIPMHILNLFLIILIVVIIERFFSIAVKKNLEKKNLSKRLLLTKFLAVAAVIIGVLGTLLGLYMAFSFPERFASDEKLIYRALKISFSTSIWGLFIALVSTISFFILKSKYRKNK